MKLIFIKIFLLKKEEDELQSIPTLENIEDYDNDIIIPKTQSFKKVKLYLIINFLLNLMIKELEIQKEIEKTLKTNLEEEILKLKNKISIIEIKILRA